MAVVVQRRQPAIGWIAGVVGGLVACDAGEGRMVDSAADAGADVGGDEVVDPIARPAPTASRSGRGTAESASSSRTPSPLGDRGELWVFAQTAHEPGTPTGRLRSGSRSAGDSPSLAGGFLV